MSGIWLDSGVYSVFSYSSQIAKIDLVTGFIGELPTHRGSATTTRHRNLVKKAWGI